ncbi:MAG: hypothetical protein GY788_21070 [bacterium]|nr:hypothetical protein [bacterium]
MSEIPATPTEAPAVVSPAPTITMPPAAQLPAEPTTPAEVASTEPGEPEAPAEPERPAYMDLFDPEAQPGWMKGLQHALPEGDESFKGLSYDNLDLEGKKLVFNLRQLTNRVASRAGRAAQEAEVAKGLAEEERASLQAERAQILALANNPELRKLLEVPEPEVEPDPMTPEGQTLLIQRQTSEQMGKFLDAWAKLADQAKEAGEQAAADIARKAQLTELEEWKPADFDDYFDAIKALRERTNGTLGIKECYALVRAEKGIVGPPRSTSEQRRILRAQANTGPQPSALGQGGGIPITSDINAIATAVQQDGEAAKKFLEKHRRRRGLRPTG